MARRGGPALAAVGPLVGAALVLSSCSGGTAARPTPSGSPPSAVTTGPTAVRTAGLDASVTQFRPDEGTRRLRAGVTNGSGRTIRVSAATIVWDALAFPTVPVPGQPTLPGQTAAFSIAYGAPRCTGEAAADPVLLAVVDGEPLRLPLRVEDPGLLRRLHASACAAQRLDRVAAVRLRLSSRTEVVRGEERLPGDLVLRHRPAARATVRLVDLAGSVLIALVPRAGRGALPGVLPAGRRALRFPVLLGSTGRCDPHARGQSTQTYLISAYVRVGTDPVQRVVLPLPSAERARLDALLDRVCG